MLLGAHYRDGSPTSVQETINVARIIYHSEYKEVTLQNDVALLKLAKPITPSDKVNIISLPKSRRDQISPGTNCFIIGKVVETRHSLLSLHPIIFRISYGGELRMNFRMETC